MADRFVLIDGCLITAAGRRIELTPSEAVILGRLVKRAPDEASHFVSTQRLARALWGPADAWPDSWANEVAVFVSKIRGKLRAGGAETTMIGKIGYGYRVGGAIVMEGGDVATDP